MNPWIVVMSCAVAVAMSCCAAKDPHEVNPHRLAGENAYRNAIADGASHQEAHRRSLLAGGSYRDQESLRRKGIIDRENR